MEKLFTCIRCSRNFRVLSRPDKSTDRPHEVEMNVECPFCSRTNAIVWPQDEYLPLVVPISENVAAESGSGDFYVEETCCMSCGVPQAIAPDLVRWTNEDLQQCHWVKQPQTADELDRAIQIIHAQEIGCHRYSGSDPAILRRLSAEQCDQVRPDLKLSHIRNFSSSGLPPKFSLSTSGEHSSAFSKLWRKLFRK